MVTVIRGGQDALTQALCSALLRPWGYFGKTIEAKTTSVTSPSHDQVEGVHTERNPSERHVSREWLLKSKQPILI